MSYWIFSVFLFVWGLAYAGLVIFTFVVSTPSHWQSLIAEGRITAQYAEYIANIPTWVVLTTFLAATSRLLGGFGLLAQKAWAFPAYAVSLLLVLILMFRGFVLADVASVIRTSQIWLEAGFLLLSVAAVWWARYQIGAGRLL